MTETISAALDRAVALYGDREAVVDGPSRWTYRRLHRTVLGFDATLDALGLGTGDVVAVLARNNAAHLVAWLGVPRSGRVLNELNTRLSESELEFILNDSGTRVLVVDDSFVDLGRNLRDKCSTLTTIVYAGTGDPPVDCLPWSEAIARETTDSATPAGVGADAVEAERVTHAMLVPTMIAMLTTDPAIEDADLSSLRSVLYGASPMPQSLLRRAAGILDCDWCQVYGMTEAAPIVTFMTHEDHRRGMAEDDPAAAARLQSAGRPVVGVEVQVRDDRGRPADPGGVGEIVVRGPNVMAGYHNRPEETAAALVDGWYLTGDMGYLDEHGYLFVVDRLKDMIITGGENVYSTEVENTLFRHDDVLEVAVFGVPDPEWGEAIHATVVLRPSTSTTSEELRAHTRSRIASYKVPRVVHVVDGALPKSGAGKILKRNLRAAYSPDAGTGAADELARIDN
ncbi:MAG: AMP-binding protein [Pseudonocardia sp.]|nr:AMP-binding protein [Pseudonocardia sp.]